MEAAKSNRNKSPNYRYQRRTYLVDSLDLNVNFILDGTLLKSSRVEYFPPHAFGEFVTYRFSTSAVPGFAVVQWLLDVVYLTVVYSVNHGFGLWKRLGEKK